MQLRHYSLLFLLSLCVCLGVSTFQHSPGYMDADYYFAGGLRLAQGNGFSELVLWNYLDDPAGLPHPSHAYWMPLASIIAWLGMAINGSLSFTAAKTGFILIAACVAPLTAALSYSLSGQRSLAWLSGLLGVMPGYYLAYFPTTDIFGLYMVCGALFFLAVGHFYPSEHTSAPYALFGGALSGLIAGTMHLGRADGVLWLALGVLAPVWGLSKERRHRSIFRKIALATAGAVIGYAGFMGWWLLRNWREFGVLLSPGGGRGLWITSYDELFIYPASQLTLARWWSSGMDAIFQARLWAAGQNLQTALAVQGLIFLAPLALWGAWRLRRNPRVQLGALAWCLTFLLMTLVFPFQGARGGFFHSGAALQPLFWALAPVGLDASIAWIGSRRNWHVPQVQSVFRGGVFVLALCLTAFLAFNRLASWDAAFLRYAKLEQHLQARGASPDQIVLVNNPPGFYVASGRPAIAIPYGDISTLLLAAHTYNARYLLLEFDQLTGETDLYANPQDYPGLKYLGLYEETRLYAILAP